MRARPSDVVGPRAIAAHPGAPAPDPIDEARTLSQSRDGAVRRIIVEHYAPRIGRWLRAVRASARALAAVFAAQTCALVLGAQAVRFATGGRIARDATALATELALAAGLSAVFALRHATLGVLDDRDPPAHARDGAILVLSVLLVGWNTRVAEAGPLRVSLQLALLVGVYAGGAFLFAALRPRADERVRPG